MNPCRAFLEDFSAFVDGHLSPARRDEIQAHVDCCQRCLDHLTAYRRGITVLRSIEAESPEDFWERLERRLWLGEELAVIDAAHRWRGSGAGRASWHQGRRPGPAVLTAAAAVLALFVIARGLGPGSAGEVGPEHVQASVAMLLPAVPGLDRDVAELAGGEVSPPRARAARPRPVVREPADPTDFVLAEDVGLSPESALVSDGWVRPVELGDDWSRAPIRPVSLTRSTAAIRPSPWNVDRAASLP